MEFRVLGDLEVWAAGLPVDAGHARQRAVLAVLLVDLGRVVPVTELIDRVWGDDPPVTVRNVLYGYVARLRAVIAGAGYPGVTLSRQAGGYRLEAGQDQVDLHRFRRLVEEAAAAAGDDDRAGALLAQAVALWRGPALAGMDSPWLNGMRDSLEAQRRTAVLDLGDIAMRGGGHGALVTSLAEEAVTYPADERLIGQLILALYRSGRQSEALAWFEQTRRLLAEEFGADPGLALQVLHRQILRADPSLSRLLAPAAEVSPAPGTSQAAGTAAGQPQETGRLPLAPRAAAELATAHRDIPLADLGRQPSQQLALTADPVLAPQDPAPPVAGPAGEPRSAASGVVGALPVVPQVRFALPADTAAFTGRDEELSRITAAVKSAAVGRGVVAVRAIGGMPGVGKTALAVHVAHLLATQFPDRQLFIDLRAHTLGHEPVRSVDALAGLLAAVGVDARYLPADPEGRAGMWRDRMAGQRALLVLDNAASSAQVAPLLPGGGACLVLVTSRRHLGDLPGAVTPILVDVLPPEEAAQMFIRLAPRAGDDRDGVAEVVALAGFLPLAVSLLARVFARHQSWTVADLIAETRAGVLTMAAESDRIATAFELSYRHLDPDSRRLFRLLGVHPGTVTDDYAAAALAGMRPGEAGKLLDGLHRDGLVTEAGHRRYGMHELLRRYARDLAAADLSGDGEQALERLLDYYQHAAAVADSRLARHTRPGAVPSAPAGIDVPDLPDVGRALAWARAERASLLACLDLATGVGQRPRVVALTAGLAAVLRLDGPWADAIGRHNSAVVAARHLGDRLGEASALVDLGDVRRRTGYFPGAARVLKQALSIYRDLGDRLGEANALWSLGSVRQVLGDDCLDVAGILEEALGIYRDLGDRLGEANALRSLGFARYLAGDYLGAAGVLEEALGIARDFGGRIGQAHALFLLGTVRTLTGDYVGATGLLEQALRIWRDFGDWLGVANTASGLGRVRRLTGDYPGAAAIIDEAVGTYRGVGGRLCEAHALRDLGTLRSLTSDHAGAATYLEEALDIYRGTGARLDEADTLREIGIARSLTGDHPSAARVLEEALGIYRRLGDRGGVAGTLNEQGTLHQAHGDPSHAQEYHQQALVLARAIGIPRDEARALAGLGRCAMVAGSTSRARILLRQAHQIFQRIGAAETRDILAELDALTRSRRAAASLRPRPTSPDVRAPDSCDPP